MQIHPYSNFVDLTKALDAVNREVLWKITQKLGCPKQFPQMGRQLHDGMTARVTDNGTVLRAFAVINGMKQDCVLAPTLFSLVFSAMLMDACRNESPDICVACRTDGQPFNHRRMHSQSLVSTTAAHKPLFADDCALNATSEGDMQRSRGLFTEMVVMHKSPPGAANHAPQNHRERRPNASRGQLHLSGSTLSRSSKLDDGVARRISKASGAFGRLQ
nr:unnamed protein product [Spirometra erinaceieuropaei]